MTWAQHRCLCYVRNSLWGRVFAYDEIYFTKRMFPGRETQWERSGPGEHLLYAHARLPSDRDHSNFPEEPDEPGSIGSQNASWYQPLALQNEPGFSEDATWPSLYASWTGQTMAAIRTARAKSRPATLVQRFFCL
jgi:hypothetical protein